MTTSDKGLSSKALHVRSGDRRQRDDAGSPEWHDGAEWRDLLALLVS